MSRQYRNGLRQEKLHYHGAGGSQKALVMALYLTGFFMFAEVGGGILTHGLALLSAAAASSDMLVVAIVGLVVNLISMRLLSAGK